MDEMYEHWQRLHVPLVSHDAAVQIAKERAAVREELDRLRLENRRLHAENEALRGNASE